MTKEDRQATDDEAKSSACADSRHIVYSVATPPYYLPQQTTGAYVVDEFFHEVGRRLCLVCETQGARGRRGEVLGEVSVNLKDNKSQEKPYAERAPSTLPLLHGESICARRLISQPGVKPIF